MADQEPDPALPPFLHLVSAFLAMEPTDSLISMARKCGSGSVTVRIQRFIWDHCIFKAISAGRGHPPYVKTFLKKLIADIESSTEDVLDEIYEQYTYYMTTLKDDCLSKGNSRVDKYISFLFPDGCIEVPSCRRSNTLVVPLQCSLNMLEGDTGCSLWPSGLFLSEFILSCPHIFRDKSCFEVGSGVGLVGVCLARVKASKVILSDGDLSTLANMKLNLKLNGLKTTSNMSETITQDHSLVKCICLPWESAPEHELGAIMPDIILGADVIYDPLCLPHLVRVLAILLKQTKPSPRLTEESPERLAGTGCASELESCHGTLKDRPVAYIASVIRNVDTFNCFLAVSEQENLAVLDITEKVRVLDFLPYMQSYEKSKVRLFEISCLEESMMVNHSSQ